LPVLEAYSHNLYTALERKKISVFNIK